MRLNLVTLMKLYPQSACDDAEMTDQEETTLKISPLEPQHEILPGPSNHKDDDAGQELPPLPPVEDTIEEDPPSPTLSPAADDHDSLQDGQEDPPPSSSDSNEDAPSDPDPDEDAPSDEDEPHITLQHMKIDHQFIKMARETTLASQLTPAELAAFLNPREEEFSPSDDPDLELSVEFYIVSLDHAQSQKGYARSQSIIQAHFPESKMLSYDQVKHRVSDLSGLVTWKHDMCVNSCIGFTGPYAHLEECPQPRCHEHCYDQHELRKSGGKKKVPQKTFTTFALGPQLQAHWKNPQMAHNMFYW